MGRAVERSGCDAGGLSKEDMVRLSKFTVGWETEEVTKAGLDSSQEKEIVSMSRWVNSLAEMGFLRAVSQSIDLAMATVALEKQE